MKEPKLVLKITSEGIDDDSCWSFYADPVYPVIIGNGYIYFTCIDESDEYRYELFDNHYRIEIVKLKEESLCKY